jgi:hypothetical protein
MHGTTHTHKIVPAASKMAADDATASRILASANQQPSHESAAKRASQQLCAGNEALLGSALFSSCCAAAFQIRRCCCFGGGVCGADADSELHSGRTSERARAIGRAMWPAQNSQRPAGQCTSSRGRTTKTCAAIFE